MTPLPPSPFCIPFVEASPNVIAPAVIPPGPAAGAVNSALERAIVADTPTGLNTSDPSVPVGVNNSPITKEIFDSLNMRGT